MNTTLSHKCKKKLKSHPLLFLIITIQIIVFSTFPITTVAAGDLPENPVVQIGNPTITSNGIDMTVDAGAVDSTWIDWQGGFNIGAQNSVNNIAAANAAVILHNDVSGVISNIQGALTGNCNVFLLNPSGILFAPGAQVNVGGLVASTLSMSMNDFMAKDYNFTGGSAVPALITNAGTITAQNEMGVSLVGGAVRNTGIINTNFGMANLISGSEVTLNMNNDGSIQAAVGEKVLSNVYDQNGNQVNVGVDNIGTITANGGQVYIQAEAVDGVFDTLINQEGIVQAGSMVMSGGKIVLKSDSNGIVQNTGTLDVSAIEPGVDGGDIEMTGSMVGQFGEVHSDALGDGDGGNINIWASEVVALNSDSLTTANAGLNGDGGEITVYSPETALFWQNARIEAKGGSNSGDGGFVEVSGVEHVEVYGGVNTLAPNGESGTFLIDPTNVTITGADLNGDWSGAGTGTWTPNLSGSTVSVDPALQAGNTIITTNFNSDGEEGDITVAGTITASNNANNLTLQAANDIILNHGINMSAGTGDLTLVADWGGGDVLSDNAGAITNGGGTITMGTGDLIMSAGDGIGTSGTPLATAGLTDVAAETNSGGIFITNSTSGDVNIGDFGGINGLDAGAGNIVVSNVGRQITVTQPIDTDSGTVTLTGDVFDINADINATGLIDINATGAITVTASGVGSSQGNVDIDGDSTFSMTGSGRITAGVGGTALTINAKGITINSGSDENNDKLVNVGTGTITLVSTGANNITLGDYAIDIDSGALSITSAGDILADNATAAVGEEITADGNVTFSAQAIGSAANYVEITGDGDIDRTLTVISTATGGEDIFISEVTAQFKTIDVTIADADVDITVDLVGGADEIVTSGLGTSLGFLKLDSVVGTDYSRSFSITLTEAGKNIVLGEDARSAVVTDGAGNVTLESANNIVFPASVNFIPIVLDTGTLSLTAGGAITTTAGGDAEISTSGDVELHATGIGATNSLDIGLDADGGTLTVDSNGNATVDIDATTANAFSSIVITQAVADNDINIQNANVNDVVTITGAGGGVTLTDVDMVTEGANFTYTLEEASSDIAITNIDASIGDVTITGASSGTITVTAAGGGIVASGASDITLTSSGAVDIDSAVATNGGIFTSTGTTFDNTGGTIGTSGGVVTIDHTDNVTVGAAIAAGAAAVNITASGVDRLFDNNAAITGDEATIIADDMALEGGTINVGANIVTLESYTTGVAIDLGTNGGAPATLSLTDAELDTITATTLRIGATDAGAISVTSALTPGAITNLSLFTTTNVSQTSGSTITVTGLKIDADTSTALNEANNVTTLAAVIADNAATFGFTDSNALTIGSVDTTDGVTTNAGTITIATTTGTFTVSNAVAAGAAAVNLTAGGVDQLFDNNAAITGNATTITADNMDLAGGTISSGSAAVTLKSDTAGIAISIGDAGASAGDATLRISDAELDTVTTSNGVIIGDTGAGAIVASGDITTPAGFANLALITGSTITGAGNTIAISGNLTLDSATGISGTGGVGADALKTDVATLAARTRTSGNILISELYAVAVGSAVNPSTAFSGITTVSNGNIDLETRGGDLTINKGITANGSGTVTIDAAGFTITQNSNDEGTISSTSGDITITAGSVDATPTNAPFYIAGVLTNQSDTGGDVYLNYADNVIDNNAGDLNIQAQTLYLTDLSTGDVAVFGAGGNEIELDVNAMGAITTGEVEFINAGDITFAAITTTTGGFTANAGTGTVTFNGNVIVFAGSNLSVTANDIIIDTGNSKTLTVSGAGTMLLQPYSSDRTINIGNDPADPPGGFDITAAEMQALACTTTVTIGQEGGTGAVTIGNDVTGGVNLSSESYNLTLHGGVTTIEQEITIPNTKTFDLNLSGAVIDSNGATATDSDVIFGATGSAGQTGTLNITAVGGVGTTGNPLEVQVGNGLATNLITISVLNGDVDAATSVIAITTTGPTTLNGVTNNDQGDITIIASSPLIVSADVITAGNGAITLTATDDPTEDDDLTVNANITIQSDQGAITLKSGNNMTINTGALIQTGGDGLITLDADYDGSSDAAAVTMLGTALVQQTGDGNIAIHAEDEVDLTSVFAGSNSTITITSDTANITDVDVGTGNDVIGGTVILFAATGIGATGVNSSLEVDATTLTATNATSGGVFINALGSGGMGATIHANTLGNVELRTDETVTLTDVDAANGTLSVWADSGNIVVTDVDTGTAGNTVALTTTNSGNIALSGDNAIVTVGATNVTITSAGSVTGGDDDATADIVAGDTLTIDAATSVGTSGVNLDLDVETIDIDADNGGIYIDDLEATGTLTVTNAGATNGDVDIASARDVSMGAISITGNLSIVAVGDLTQTAAATVGGTSNFSVGANAITLTQANNDFIGAVSLANAGAADAKDIAITDANSLILGTVTTPQDLRVVIGSGGTLSQTGVIAVTRETVITATTTGDVLLGNTANNFDDIQIVSAGDVTLADAGAIDFDIGATAITGNFTLTSGAVTQANSIDVGGTTDIDAGAAAITLTQVANNFVGAVSLSSSGVLIQVTDEDALVLGDVAGGAGLTVIAAGAITQNAEGVVVVGQTTVTAGAGNNIVLTTASNDFNDLQIVSGNNVSITDIDDIQFDGGASAVSGNLVVSAGGAITQDNALSIAGVTTINANGGTITLTHADNNFQSAVNIISGDTVQISNAAANTLIVGSVDTTGTLTLSAATLEINGSVSADDINITGGNTAFTLAGDLLAKTGNIGLTNAVQIDGNTNVISSGGNITFSGEIDADAAASNRQLYVTASGGTVNFADISNGDPDLHTLVVTADTINFNNAVSVGVGTNETGQFTVNGSGGTTTIAGDVTSAVDVEYNDNVVLSNDVKIDTTGGPADITVTGTINATAANTQGLWLTTGTGNVSLGNSLGNTVALEYLNIDSTGTTTLNGLINTSGTVGGEDLDLAGATNVILGSNVSLVSATQDVILNTVNGAFDLTVNAGADITLGAAIGGTTNLHDISMTAGTDVDVDAGITATGTVTLASGGVAGEDILLDANVIGSAVTFEAGASGDVTIGTVAQNNTSGSTTINGGGGINLSQNITAAEDLTVNDDITLLADVDLTSTSGDIDLNADVFGDFNLDLTATHGDVSITTIGVGGMVNSLDIVGDTAELNGNITTDLALNILTGGGTATIADNLHIISTNNSVRLGTLDGQKDLTISAGNVVELGNANIGSLHVDDAFNVLFTGNFITSGAVTVDTAITSEIDIAIGQSIQAGGAVQLGALNIDINGIVSGDSVDLDTSGGAAITLSSNVTADTGNVLIHDPVTLDGNSIVSSTNGNVTFSNTVGGAFGLTANADNGIVSFDSTVGVATDELTSLTVSANEARLNGNIETDGGTTADVDFRGTMLVTLENNVTIDTATDNAVGGDILFGTASSVVGNYDLILNTDAATTDGNVQINDADVDLLTLTGVNVATLYGTILSDDSISLSGATTVTLADTASLETTNGDVAHVLIDTDLNGAHTLTVTSTGDATFDGITQLTGLTVTADSVDFTDTVGMPGSIAVTVSDAAADAIDVQAAVDSTNGSITFTGQTELKNAAFSAGQNVTLNSAVTLAADLTITADNGSIDLNAAVDSSTGTTRDLTLTADTGTVYAQGLGTGVRLEDLDINANAAQLNGSIVAETVDTTGVGVTTLTAATVDIDTVGFTTINLGNLTGNNLTISAGTTVVLAGGTPASVDIDDASDVTFSGNLTTTGEIRVDSAVTGTVTVTGDINAGTDLTLDGDTKVQIDGEARASGITSLESAILDINNDVVGDTVNLTGTTTLTLAGDVTAGNGNVEVNSALTLDGASLLASANGDVNVDSTIDGGEVLTVSAGDTVTFTGAIGDTTALTSLTVTAGTLIDMDGAVGDAAADGAGILAFTGAANIGADIYVTTSGLFNDDLTLSGAARTVEASAAGSTLTFNDDINGAFGLTLTTPTGAAESVTLTTIGESGANISSLDVNTTTALLNGDITVDGSVRFDGTTTTTVQNDLTIDTILGANATIVDFAILNGNNALTIAGGDADVDFNGAVTQLTGLSVTSSDTVTVDATIDVPGAVLLTSSVGTDIDANIGTTTAAASVTLNGAVTIDSDITAVNNIVINDAVTLDGDDVALISNNGSVDLNAAVDSSTGTTRDLTLTANSGTVYAEGLGTGVRLEDLDINANTAQLDGSIVAETVDTTGVGVTTLTAATVDIDTVGFTTINLGNLAGNNLTISAGTTVDLAGGTPASVDIDDATNVTFGGNLTTIGEIRVDSAVTGTVTVTGDINAGTDLTLDGDTEVQIDGEARASGTTSLVSAGVLDINNDVIGDTVNLTGTTTLTLAGDVTAGNGNVEVNNALTLDGTSSVTSDEGDVNFDVTIAGAHIFEVNADNGTVTFTGQVGAADATALALLTVNASAANLNAAIYADGGTTADVDFRQTDQINLTAGVTIDTENGGGDVAGDILFGQGSSIDGDFALVLDATGTTNGVVQINDADIDQLTVTALRADLFGTIETDEALSLAAAASVVLGDDVSLITTENDADITAGVITGAYDLSIDAGQDANIDDTINEVIDLTVIAGRDVNVTGIIGGVTPLGSVSMTASQDIDIDSAITATGLINLDTDSAAGQHVEVAGQITGGTVNIDSEQDVDIDSIIIGAGTVTIASGGVAGEDILVDANVIGAPVIFDAGAAGDVTFSTVAQNNTAGSTTINAGGGINTAVSLIADDDLTINDELTLVLGAPGTITLTSNTGDIDLNDSVEATTIAREALTLTATNGAIYIEDIGIGTQVGALDINAKTAQIDGDLDAASVDTTDTGVTTLTGTLGAVVGVGTVNIETTGLVTLGTLAGNDLQIDAGTTAALADADIASLTIIDATTVDFNGNFVTSGDVSVSDQSTITGTITVAATTGSIQAGGAVTLINNDTGGTGIVISGPVTGSAGVTMAAYGANNLTINADVSAEGDGIIDLNAPTGSVTIAQNSPAAITAVNGKINIDAGSSVLLGTGSLVGQLVTTGTGNIEIDAVTAFTMGAASGTEVNAGGAISIGQATNPATITVAGDGMTAADNITATADNTITLNADVTSTDAGDISFTSDTSGNINIADDIRTTGTGDVTLTAISGSIVDSDVSAENEYITGDYVTLTASANIGVAGTGDIDTQAVSLNVSSTTAGTIVIDEYDEVILADLDTVDGAITVNSGQGAGNPGGRITATDVNAGGGAGDSVALETTTGGMILTSVLANDDITATADAGDITIALVGDTGTDDIVITATTGAIDEVATEDPGDDIVGDVLTLNAQDGVGQSYALEIDVNSLNSTISAPGDINITDSDDIILTDVSTTDGSITIEAGGQITATSVNASGDNQDVTLTATAGDIVMTLVLADDDITATSAAGITIDVVGDSGTDDVTLTAQSGSILGIDVDAAAEITGDAVVLTATAAIGGASGGATEIETEVTTISADSTSAGDIIFEELDADGDGVNLLSVDANNGAITVVTNGGTHEAETETTITFVKSDSGVSGAHDISIIATTGDVTLAGNTTDTANVESDNDIIITATAGSITEDSTHSIPGDSYVDIKSNDTTSGLLTITAGDEIGSLTGELDIETTIAILDASSTTAGDIVITETDAINLLDVDTQDGAITIVAGGQITATDVSSLTDSDDNDISLHSTGGGIEVKLINAGALGDVTLNAEGGAVTQDGDVAVDVVGDVLIVDALGGIDLDTTVTSIDGDANAAGTITIDETNAITLTNLATTDGSVTVDAGGDMTVTLVTAGGETGSNDDVTLTTTAGDIIMSGDITALNDVVTLVSAANITDTTDATTDISAADLALTVPAGTVGATGLNNELDTDVDTITAAVQGDTYILEQDAITLTSVVTTNGLVDIEAGGTITTNTVTAGGANAVNLNSTGGDIVDTATGMITAGAASSLRASGIIGTTTNALDVNVNGDLWVWANSSTDQVSANLQGIVNGTGDTERVEIYDPSPPGLVLLDNRLMGGGNYGSGSANGSILSFGYGYSALAQFDVFGVSYAKALQPWGYKITLPWILTEGAKMDNDLLRPTPALIDAVQLNLPVLGVQNIMPSYYVIYPFAK